MKKTKRNSIQFFPGIFAIVMFALLIAVSVAVYTNQGYKKGVAITADSDAMFSSNLLEQIPEGNADNQGVYQTKDASALLGTDTEMVSFSFEIYNYAPNAPNRVNPIDIIYDLTVSIVSSDSTMTKEGFSVKPNEDDPVYFSENECIIEGLKLARPNVSTHSFTVNMPKAAVDKFVQFAIKAVPQSESLKATNNMGLAIIVTPVLSTGGTPEVIGWSGHWVEKTLAGSTTSNLKPSDCDAFNYELSGTGQGTVTLTWPPALSIDPIFLDEVVETQNNNNSISFQVNSNEKAVYKIRFYRTGESFPTEYPEGTFTTGTAWPAIDTFVKTESTPTP